MCTHPSRAIIRCHADSCPSSLTEVKQCIFRWYLSCPSVVRIVGVFYHNCYWGGIIFGKSKNSFWGIFSYFGTRVPTPNEQPFLPFVILPPYFCSGLSLLTFYYIFLYFSYLGVAIFYDIMKFELNLFFKVSTSRYWLNTLYPLCSYIKQPP